MMVLVDTSVWSISIRRDEKNLSPAESKIRSELAQLIREGRARVIGPIRQELLSGIRDETKFKRVQHRMRALEDDELQTADYEEAARISNSLRCKGINGTPIDCLICAVALRLALAIFTTDQDFRRYSNVIPMALHTIS
jgi:predicted nucleic acid-binding protein